MTPKGRMLTTGAVFSIASILVFVYLLITYAPFQPVVEVLAPFLIIAVFVSVALSTILAVFMIPSEIAHRTSTATSGRPVETTAPSASSAPSDPQASGIVLAALGIGVIAGAAVLASACTIPSLDVCAANGQGEIGLLLAILGAAVLIIGTVRAVARPAPKE